MTRVMVKNWFSSYTGVFVQMYVARGMMQVIVVLPDGTHRVAPVTRVIQLDPQMPVPVPTQPRPQEHGEGGA